MKRMLNTLVVKPWQAYIKWCDAMGLTPESKRCCAPRLQDPDISRDNERNTNRTATKLDPVNQERNDD